MNQLTDLTYLKSFLKQSGLKPRHYLGQNFLVDEEVLEKIVQAAQLKKSDTVLEVGPGVGTLTVELAKYAGQVIAVEKDPRISSILKQYFHFSTYVQIWEYDILKFDLDKHIKGPYKVVANIPYYLTSHLIKYFLEQKNKPKLLVLMVQKEVGERVVAQPGKLSVLGISVQFFADAEIATIVPKQSFWPISKVDSAILRIEPKNSAKGGSASGGKFPQVTDHKLFFRLIKTAFAGKRKQLKNTIRNPEALRQAGIDPRLRPQDLAIEDWVRLYKFFKED